MKKRVLYFLMTMVFAVGMASGCSKTSSAEETTLYGKVTAVDGKKITIALAEEPTQGEKPEGEAPGGDGSGEAPEKPDDSTAGSGVEAPEGDGQPGGGPELTLTGEDKTITITDDTEIKKQSMGGGQAPGSDEAGTEPSDSSTDSEKPEGQPSGDMEQQTEDAAIDDIIEGVIVTVTMKNDTAASITIQGGGANDGAGGTDGTTTGNIELTGVYTVNGTSEASDKETFESAKENESAVLVSNGGALTMTNGILDKSGDTSSADESNFYGLNAVFAVTSGSEASVSDTTLASGAEGANAIFATGEKAQIHVENVNINTISNSSRGLDATYGGSIDATDVTIATAGDHSAPIATDRGGGTVTVDGGTLNAAGDGSPCIYSTGDITARNVTGTATGSQALVVEGKNRVTLKKSTLTGAGENGLMLYQSTSGDAQEGKAELTAGDSTISTTSDGPMIYVTNTDAQATFENTKLKFESGTLVKVSGNNTNNWGTVGSNGGNFILNGKNQKFEGAVTCDGISTVTLNLAEKTAYKGAVNADNAGKEVHVALDKDSTLELTGDSHVTTLTDEDETCSNIISNGHTLYYNASDSENEWLGAKTLTLSDGGKIAPAA
ncbi:ICP22 family protein [Hespellia stercorisuis]|uniref:Carbohydrate-binding domain-containing protein n=1 Tax=Hespellia stercorisuis DSM 15480 TaxID=1121950 RepID=A0A1M6JTU9_9FIRM|nr:hypothetical protein [Hespellia stercorisuis]SHJ50165.1 hypothetical protein SAMN02745243_00725 [Hespellia stercorisuis DSM 15480]